MTFLSALTTRHLPFACALAFGALAPATHALAQHATVVADIPFPFHDSAHTFPAGKYLIKETSENMILIRNAGSDQIGISMAMEQFQNTASPRGGLVFYKYGDQYFLRDIWLANSNVGRQVVMGGAEKKLRKAPAKRPAPADQIALNVTQP